MTATFNNVVGCCITELTLKYAYTFGQESCVVMAQMHNTNTPMG